MAEQLQGGTSGADWLKYLAAVALVAGGIAGFYLLDSLPGVVRGLIVAASIVAAGFVVAFTRMGGEAREFFHESLFEMRKVVWPTRQEAWRITLVVLVVVVIISLVLAGFDFVISNAVEWLLKA